MSVELNDQCISVATFLMGIKWKDKERTQIINSNVTMNDMVKITGSACFTIVISILTLSLMV
jgi:hypothetical protein